MAVRWQQRIYTQIWWSQISGSGRCPKWVVQKKADFRTTKNRPIFRTPKKRPFFGGRKKRSPKKGPKNGRFLGPGNKADF